MITWAALKVTAPQAYVGIFSTYYGADVGTSIVYVLGGLQIAFLIAYLLGLFKTITTGGVLLMNLVTLIVSIPKILPVGSNEPNILFVASFPVLGASLAHFLMRRDDTFLSLGK